MIVFTICFSISKKYEHLINLKTFILFSSLLKDTIKTYLCQRHNLFKTTTE